MDLPPCLTVTGPSSFPPQGWGKPGEKESFSPDPISEGDEEDACSIPDSLPDLIDSTGEEECPSPIGLVREGIAPSGILLYQDSVRSNRFLVVLKGM